MHAENMPQIGRRGAPSFCLTPPLTDKIGISYVPLMKDPVIDRVVKAAGGPTLLANALGIRAPSVYSWKKIPPARAADIEKITGIPRHELRPDLWQADAA